MALAVTLAAVGSRLQVELGHILENMGLTDREFRILLAFYVLDPEPVAPADLAFHVGLSRGSLHTTVRKLQQAGYVARQRNRQRRGATNLLLSPRGRKAADERVAEYLAGLAALGNRLEVTEAAAAAALAQWPFAHHLAARDRAREGAL